MLRQLAASCVGAVRIWSRLRSGDASPRRVVRIGFLSLFVNLVILIALRDLGAGPEIIT